LYHFQKRKPVFYRTFALVDIHHVRFLDRWIRKRGIQRYCGALWREGGVVEAAVGMERTGDERRGDGAHFP
jgi:hypothetical protein